MYLTFIVVTMNLVRKGLEKQNVFVRIGTIFVSLLHYTCTWVGAQWQSTSTDLIKRPWFDSWQRHLPFFHFGISKVYGHYRLMVSLIGRDSCKVLDPKNIPGIRLVYAVILLTISSRQQLQLAVAFKLHM